MNTVTELLIRSIEEITEAEYRRQGFLVTQKLFDASTMARVRQAFEHKWRALIEADTKGDAKVARSRNNLFPSGLHLEYPELATFLHHPIFQELCRRLVGPEADLTWNQGIIKPGKTGGQFAWHQDGHFAITEPMDAGFTCWLAVTPATVENGTLWVAPEYYGRGLLSHIRDVQGTTWQCQFDGQPEPKHKIPVELEPGQMLLFSRFMPHSSGPNQTDGVRIAYQIGFGPPGAILVKTGEHFGNQVPLLRGGKPCA